MPLLGIVLLRGSVFWSAHPAHHCSCAGIVRVYQLGQPKVHQHRLPLPGDDDILWLHVPVDDTPPVAVVQRIQQLPCPSEDFCFRQLTLLDNDFIQSSPVNKVHHQVGIVIFFEIVADTGQVRMMQSSQQPCFLLKLLTQFGQLSALCAGEGSHLLERAADVKRGVHRLIDGAHAALAQQSDDPVALVDHLPGDHDYLLLLASLVLAYLRVLY